MRTGTSRRRKQSQKVQDRGGLEDLEAEIDSVVKLQKEPDRPRGHPSCGRGSRGTCSFGSCDQESGVGIQESIKFHLNFGLLYCDVSSFGGSSLSAAVKLYKLVSAEVTPAAQF